MRRTKIVATLGPASDSPEMIARLITAGVDVFRLNFSHGAGQEHIQRCEDIREQARKQNRFVAVLADLQGPKIRIAKFANGGITLANGDEFFLDADHPRDSGDQQRVGIDYPDLVSDLSADDCLLLDDGRIRLRVIAVDGNRVQTRVEQGGQLKSNKGINKLGGGLSAPALTEKDKADIHTIAQMDADFVAVSFPREARDIETARQLLTEAGSTAHIVAKIERAEAVEPDTLDGIITASDGVMVARGDLGVEIGDENLVARQKTIIARSVAQNKAVITATQMMESMITSPLPTRAEVFDVANAVLDGTDAVMLSAETAVGEYPVATVEAMGRVIEGAESHPTASSSTHRLTQRFDRIDESIALGSMYIANHLDSIAGVVTLTESGYTPRLMSRIHSSLPIFALADVPRTQHVMALYRGVYTVPFNFSDATRENINSKAVDVLVEHGVVKAGDHVIITKGDYTKAHGGTNALKIVKVGEAVY